MMSHRTLYWIVIGIFGVLLVTMLVAFDYSRANSEAEKKADELIAAYEDAGLPAPMDAESLARVLGDDGGAVCASAGSHVQTGYLRTRLGVGGEFYFRPTRVQRNVIKGFVLIAQVYCPDKLADLKDLYDGLRFADVIRS